MLSEYKDISYKEFTDRKMWEKDCFGLFHVIDNEFQFWIKNGMYHRIDGPALIYASDDSGESWYIDGKNYGNNKEFQDAARLSDEDMAVLILKYGNVY